ncbi:hypothetical protein HYX13_02885 [Candidatus Woesearchaeota archaeon]|nr:hypothetical protein [Candidatus Woesearchaeota archaeon]
MAIDFSQRNKKLGYKGETLDNIVFFLFGSPLKILRTAVATVALTLLSYQCVGNNITYSEGVRVGMINKFSNRGLFWKTYEGEMALEGIASGENSVGANVWRFSLDRYAKHGEDVKTLVKEVLSYAESGTKAKVTYVEPLVTWPWRSGTDYLVQSIEPIEEKK